MKKVGHTSEFLVGIYWWTWKNKYLLKRRMTPSKIGKTSRGIIILHMCTINQNHMMSGSWNMKHDREFVHILDHFLPLYPTTNLKNQNFEKKKKMPGDIIFHMCTKSYDHMMYGSWDMVQDEQMDGQQEKVTYRQMSQLKMRWV